MISIGCKRTLKRAFRCIGRASRWGFRQLKENCFRPDTCSTTLETEPVDRRSKGGAVYDEWCARAAFKYRGNMSRGQHARTAAAVLVTNSMGCVCHMVAMWLLSLNTVYQ